MTVVRGTTHIRGQLAVGSLADFGPVLGLSKRVFLSFSILPLALVDCEIVA